MYFLVYFKSNIRSSSDISSNGWESNLTATVNCTTKKLLQHLNHHAATIKFYKLLHKQRYFKVPLWSYFYDSSYGVLNYECEKRMISLWDVYVELSSIFNMPDQSAFYYAENVTYYVTDIRRMSRDNFSWGCIIHELIKHFARFSDLTFIIIYVYPFLTWLLFRSDRFIRPYIHYTKTTKLFIQ